MEFTGSRGRVDAFITREPDTFTQTVPPFLSMYCTDTIRASKRDRIIITAFVLYRMSHLYIANI